MSTAKPQTPAPIVGYDDGGDDGPETIVIGHKIDGHIYIDATYQEEIEDEL